ncbi:Uncharacterised protein [Pseudomonas fluorescens]|nr:Uncharacterised protein [Pseudomonas fluorescens]
MAYLNWNEAPQWATHIVADIDLPCIQCWARKVGGDFYSETFIESLAASFHMVSDEIGEEPGSWMLVSERPVPVKEAV